MKDAKGHGSDTRGAAHQSGVEEAIRALPWARWSGYPAGGYHAINPDTGEVLKHANAKYGDFAPRFKTEAKADAFARKRLGK